VGRVTLTGRPNFELHLATLAEQVAVRAHLHYDVQLSPSYKLEQLAEEQTARGLLVRRFQAQLDNAKSPRERSQTEGALHCALRALEGKQMSIDEVS